MLLSIATIFLFRIGCIDIKGAYLQSGPILRDIYIRPPPECGTRKGVLWKLKKMPYGISEAERQWAKVIEGWLVRDAGFKRVIGVSQLYVRKDNKSRIQLILAKITDDLLISGLVEHMTEFSEEIKKRFKISKVIVDSEVKFNGCSITQDTTGSIRMTIKKYLESIQPFEISKARKALPRAKAGALEMEQYRTMAGELIWIGCGTLPQAAYFGSLMQQRIPNLTIGDMISGNRNLRKLNTLDPKIMFRVPENRGSDKTDVITFSDASFNISSRQEYGQTGLVTGILHGRDIFHIIDWESKKSTE